MSKKDKYNSSGYLDMTAYLAMRNVECKERKSRVTKNKGRNIPRREKTGERDEQKQ